MDEKNLKESELKFRSIVTAMEEGVVFQEKGGQIIAANPAAEKILGLREADLIGQTSESRTKEAHIIHEDGTPFPGETHPAMVTLRTGEPQKNVVMGLERPDGTFVWISINSQPLVYEGEERPYAVVTTFRDITERKQAELRLRQSNRILQMLSETNQALIHATEEQSLLDTIAQIVVQKGGYQLMWIGFAEQDEGKTVRPVAQAGFGSEYVSFARVSWADNTFGRGPTGVAIRTGKTQVSQDIQSDPKMTPWREAAVKRGYKSSIALPLITNGHAFGALNIYAETTDAFGADEIRVLEELANDLAFGITALRLRAEREKVEERAQELNEVRSKFIDIISHQLRTPLTAINWNLEALLDGEYGKLDSIQHAFLQFTYAASIEVTNRIHNLLTAMDIEEGRVRYVTEEIIFSSLCAAVVNELRKKAELKNLVFTFTMPPQDITIYGDGEKVRMALSILVQNAIDYTKEGGSITMTLQQSADMVRFSVIDTGVGIGRAEQHLIGTRFFRASNASVMKTDAFGLGLFIAKNFAEQHHGSVGFESTEGKGSTFWLELPFKK